MRAFNNVFKLASVFGAMTFGLMIGSTAEAGLITAPRISIPTEVKPAVIQVYTEATRAPIKARRPQASAVKSAGKPLSLVPRRFASIGRAY